MSILVVAENSNKEIKSSTLNSINAASKINDDIHLVVIGNQCEEVAKKAALIELAAAIELRVEDLISLLEFSATTRILIR